ncbi:MAG: hypothetical protein E7570_06160 [Ruminococcaceae bacterium]|nr:hypothetical protein [Oscillospiraceae bacterium]
MSDNKRRALVDTDFVNHIISSSTNGKDILQKIFEEFNIIPVVHPWVAANEFVTTGLQNLLKTGIIKVLSQSEIVGSDDEFLKQYEAVASQMYLRLNDESISFDGKIFEIRKAQSSLGEIHTVITAKYLSIPIMCSDDHGAKDIAPLVNNDSFKLCVYNAFDVINEISQNSETKITYKECDRILSKCNEFNTKRYKELTKTIKENYRTHEHIKR